MDMYINGKKVNLDESGALADLARSLGVVPKEKKDVEAPVQKENPMNIEKRLNELENNITALNKRLDAAIGVGSETLAEMYDLIEELIEEVKEVVEVASEDSECGGCCGGCCSTGIACLNTDRNFIGIELDDGYFDIGVNRIKEHIESNTMNVDLTVKD